MVSVIFLAGGVGNRMKLDVPKQFHRLDKKIIAHYSLDIFLQIDAVTEIIVVCAEEYRHHFNPYSGLKWANPGIRRQDSVYNGLEQVKAHSKYVCVHDCCRPFIDIPLVERVLTAAKEHGAACCGVPVKFTIKEVNQEGFVACTPDRSKYWEIQTPQILLKERLIQGYVKVHAENLEMTDDVSIVETLNYPVKIVEGLYSNLKITTPEDLSMAENLLKSHG